jgi:subtilisin family serine protease
MKKISLTLLLFCLFFLNSYSKLTPDLWQKMHQTEQSELIRINIIMDENYPIANDPNLKNSLSKKERNQYLVNTLQAFAQQNQAEVLTHLENYKIENAVSDITPLWISNVITCQATQDVILDLVNMKSIAVIDWDEERNMLFDTRRDGYDNDKDREITWNVSLINAPSVWNQGYSGAGVLVAVIDTGINYNHADLNDHMWQHSSYPNHGYNFYANNYNPMDDNGHGTHCAGTVAGDGTAGSQTGVAPNATIMALKVLGSDGNGNESNVWQAIQFAVTHQVDVMSISLGWMHSWNPQRATWRTTMNNALAAGLVASVAAGNSGDQQYTYPIPDNVATPGDCPPPWFHPDQTLTSSNSAVICVGSTTNTNSISSFSSRGPITWQNVNGYNDYNYNPGMGLIRPDIVAPGSNIKSLAHYSNYGYESGWSGTSMATPAVAGVIALMLSKNPYLTPAEINQILEENTLLLSPSKSNTFGSGRVDALAAVNATFLPNISPGQVINPLPIHNAICVSPASLILHWQNGEGAPADFYQISIGTDYPPSNLIMDAIVFQPFFETAQLFVNETTYYWKVNAFNEFGFAEGNIWSFTTLGFPDEDFESGDFTLYPWQFSGHSTWQIASDTAASGIYSVKSGAVNAFENSTLSIQINVLEAGNLVFWKKVSSEENNDRLRFFINNFMIGEWSGELNWSQETYYLIEGQYDLVWKYQKLDPNTAGQDCAWLDYIIFPEMGELIPPVLDVNIAEINHEMNSNDMNVFPFQITNTGGGELTYSLSIAYQSELTGWLGLNIANGSVAENETDEIEAGFYTYSIPEGTYLASIMIQSNAGEPFEITVQLTVFAVSSDMTEITSITTLQGNYPNPFNPTTTIHFSLAQIGNVEIKIFNSKGQFVRTLLNETRQSGVHQIVWNGLDEKNQPVSSGIYLYQMRTENLSAIKKMLMIK